MNRNVWTNDEVSSLCDMYNSGMKIADISKELYRTESSVKHKIDRLGLSDNIIKKNNPKYKAVYQDYDWCYERFIVRGMTHEEMAKEGKTTIRTIQKWCVEKHGLNARTFKKYKKLSDIQRQLIMFSLLGDGHIDKREKEPLFIVSHAENQKDYLYWKYNILKDLCASEPIRHDEKYTSFGTDKKCQCKPTYRFGTRIINDLIPIREMSKSDIISQINEFGMCIHILDDGYRSNSNWQLCIAAFNEEEKHLYIDKCKENLGLICGLNKDTRYVSFDAESSRRIDNMILANVPNDLDIVQYKIINKDICKPANYFYVHTVNEDIGLGRYCKIHHCNYNDVKNLVTNLGYQDINEMVLINLLEGSNISHD